MPALSLVLALAAAQAPQGPVPIIPGEQPAEAREPRALALPAPRLPPAVPRYPRLPPGTPALRDGVAARCLLRADGTRWRAQCDRAAKVCLAAPDAELSADGEPRASLERAPPCVGPDLREDALLAEDVRIVPAIAEAPPGWRRDERQRVMQVSFDLGRRLWLGAGQGLGSFPWSGPEATLGVRWDVPFRLAGAPALARVRALETTAALDGSMADMLVAAVDASRAYPSPLLRITTFVGRPRRFDPPLYVGLYAEVARAETLRTGTGRWFDRQAFGPVAITLDLWRSVDLSSFVRLRAGAGYETADQLEGAAWTPGGGADLDLTVDQSGLHHLRASFTGEFLLAVGDGGFQPPAASGLAPLPDRRRRLTGKAEYEVVLLAVNDQPLSAVLDVRAQQRDDVPGHPTGWKVQGTAGLRFNLWAPALRVAPAQDRL